MAKFLKYCTCFSLLLALVGCNNEDNSSIEDNNTQHAHIETNISQFGSNSETRGTYSVSLANKAVNGLTTTFENGDAIGIFAVTTDGKIISSNIKGTYSNGDWTLSTPIDNLSLLDNYSFYAYYPYQTSLSSSYNASSTISGSTAKEFFATLISGWSPLADQSTKNNFSASDLMIADSSVSDLTINFTFQHQMGLVVTKAARYFQDSDGNTYLDDTNTFSGNLPYSVDNWLLYLVKPNTNTVLGKYTYNIDSNEYFQDVINI